MIARARADSNGGRRRSSAIARGHPPWTLRARRLGRRAPARRGQVRVIHGRERAVVLLSKAARGRWLPPRPFRSRVQDPKSIPLP